MHTSDYCRRQSDECLQKSIESEIGEEATLLASISKTWTALANQIDKYMKLSNAGARRTKTG